MVMGNYDAPNVASSDILERQVVISNVEINGVV